MCTARRCYELRFTCPQAFLTNRCQYHRIRATQSVSLLIDAPLTYSFHRARCDARSRSVAAMRPRVVHSPLSAARNIARTTKRGILSSQQNCHYFLQEFVCIYNVAKATLRRQHNHLFDDITTPFFRKMENFF